MLVEIELHDRQHRHHHADQGSVHSRDTAAGDTRARNPTPLAACFPPRFDADGQLKQRLADTAMRRQIRQEFAHPTSYWESLCEQATPQGVLLTTPALRATPQEHLYPMEYRNLGRTGVKVSSLCLGAMMFGGRTEPEESWAIIDRNARKGKLPSDHAPLVIDVAEEPIR